MPSPFAHVTTGYIIYRLYKKKLPLSPKRFWGISLYFFFIAGLSLLPDLDALPGLLFRDFGRFHNNLTHSIFMGLVVALVVSGLVFLIDRSSWKTWFWIVLISYELHIVMDFFSAERGVMLFWPFTEARFIPPFKIFYGLQWKKGPFSILHLWTFFTEALFFMFLWLIYQFLQRNQVNRTPAPPLPEEE